MEKNHAAFEIQGSEEMIAGYVAAVILSESDCRLAATALGRTFVQTGDWSTSPPGCLDATSGDGRGLFFNTHSTGGVHPHQQVVCFVQGACMCAFRSVFGLSQELLKIWDELESTFGRTIGV